MDRPGYTLWFTGLSASGKSTLSEAVQARLADRLDRRVYVIDGDHMRRTINRGLGYSLPDRNEATERIAHVAGMLNDNGVVCLVSNISQNRAVRRRVREIIERIVMIFVDAPPEVCAERDHKGNWAKALNGEMDEFVGVTMPYERPEEADVVIDAACLTPDQAADQVLDFLADQGLLDR